MKISFLGATLLLLAACRSPEPVQDASGGTPGIAAEPHPPTAVPAGNAAAPKPATTATPDPALPPAANPTSTPATTPTSVPEATPTSVPTPAGSPTSAPTKDATPPLTEAEFRALHEPTVTNVPAPRRGEIVDLGGTKAYLSLPAGAAPGLPGVLLVHEWWGLNVNIEHWTDRLAAEGYAALAVDLYDGAVVTTREDATRLATAVSPERASAILAAAERFLRENTRTLSPRVAAIGWGFGGHYALLHAIGSKDLAGVVVYYGSPITEPEQLAKMQASLLAIFGTHDKSITPEAVADFEHALTAAGRKFRILRYEAEHAFANPSSSRYSEAIAQEAWTEARTFLERVLRSP